MKYSMLIFFTQLLVQQKNQYEDDLTEYAFNTGLHSHTYELMDRQE